MEGPELDWQFAKKIVELHRGNIWVESEQGKGSKFYFTISRKKGETYEKA